MNSQFDRIRKILDRGVSYNLIVSIVLIGIFITWQLTHNMIWPLNPPSDDLEFLEELNADNKISIDKNTVTKTIYGKAIFRTARMLPVKTVDVLGRFDFKGTSSRDGVLKAYIKDTKMNKTYSLNEGDQFGGVFTLMEIQRDAIMVQRGNDRMRLEK